MRSILVSPLGNDFRFFLLPLMAFNIYHRSRQAAHQCSLFVTVVERDAPDSAHGTVATQGCRACDSNVVARPTENRSWHGRLGSHYDTTPS